MSLEDVLWDMHEEWRKRMNDNVNPVFKPTLDSIFPPSVFTSRCQEIIHGGIHCWKLLPCSDHDEHKCKRCGDPMGDMDRIYCDLCRGWEKSE